MRTREQIEEEDKVSRTNAIVRDFSGDRILEVLLDIRELLSPPSVQSDYGKAEREINPE